MPDNGFKIILSMSAQQKFYKRTKNLKACIVQEVGTWERSLKSKEEKIITQKGPSISRVSLPACGFN